MVLLSLLPGLTVSAQEQKTTAARTVIVVDQAGPVIGASVVIKGTVSGFLGSGRKAGSSGEGV